MSRALSQLKGGGAFLKKEEKREKGIRKRGITKRDKKKQYYIFLFIKYGKIYT